MSADQPTYAWAKREAPTCGRCEASGLKWVWDPRRREARLYDPALGRLHNCDGDEVAT